MSNEPDGNLEAAMGSGVDGARGRGGFSLRNVRNIRTLTSFKNPVYRIYFTGTMGDMLSQNMQMMARSLLVYRITGSGAILGMMALATTLPMLLLSLFGGVIADRVQKKFVIFFGQLASVLISLGVALCLTLGYLSTGRADSWWILIIASALQGVSWGFMGPSRQAIIREIVAKEELMNAVSLSTSGMNILRIFAPAIAGFLIDGFGFAAVYYTMTGMYCLALFFTALLPRTSTITARSRSALSEMKEGFQYIRQETRILLVLLFTLVAVVLSMPYNTLLPIFTEDILEVGASGLGWLMSISGVGAIFGSVTLASLPNKKRGLLLLASSLVLSMALVGFSFSTSWSLSLVLIVFVGLGNAGRMTLSNTLLQYYSEDEYRGRVMSFYMMEFGLISFGTFAAGLLSESMGVQWAVGGFALVLIFLTMLTLVFVPRLRKLD